MILLRALAVGICAVWGISVALLVSTSLARVEYAQAALEGRAVAASFDSTMTPARASVRDLVAAGRFSTVKRQFGALNLDSLRLATVGWQAAALTLTERYIVAAGRSPDGSTMGVVILRSRWWEGSVLPWIVIAIASLASAALVWRAMSRIIELPEANSVFLTADALAVLATATVILAMLPQELLETMPGIPGVAPPMAR